MVPFVQMVYYPTESGEPAYVHYTSRLNGESLQPVDEWGQLNPDAEAALLGLIDYYGIALQPAILTAPAVAEPALAKSAVAEEAAPAVVPVTSPAAPVVNPYLIAGLVTALLVLIGIGLTLKRRSLSQPSA